MASTICVRISRVLLAFIVAFAVVGIHRALADAPAILWTGTGSSAAWLSTGNWQGAAVPTAAQIADFGTANSNGNTIGINMNTAGGNQQVGAIEFLSTRTAGMTIGDSSTTVNGTLTLNGVQVNSVSNTIIRNASGQTLTLQNSPTGSGTQTMSVTLGNSTDNIVSIEGAGNVNIISVVVGASRHLTLQGGGSGALVLSGANTYSGGTAISKGRLVVSNSSGSGTGSGAVAVGDGTGVNSGNATLTGTGIITGAVTTTTTGSNIARLAPGVNTGTTNFGVAGTLRLNGGLSIGTGTILDFDLANTTAGTSDLITLNTTTLTLGSNFTFNFGMLGASLATTGNYTLISGASNVLSLDNITINTTGLESTAYTAHYTVSGGALLVNFDSGNGTATPNYFDTNGSVAGIGINGGTSVWDTTTTNWNPVVAGTGTPKLFDSTQTAYFGASGSGTAGPVSVDAAGVNANNGIQFDVTGYTINGGAITMGGATPTITVTNMNDSATVSSKISGSLGLTKAGAGTLILDAANDFTGAVNLSAGTLSVGSDGNLGAASNALVFAGGTLKTTGAIAAARAITITAAGGGGTFNTNGFDSSTSGATTISDAFTKAGVGDLSLNGTIAFGANAALTVSGGSLTLNQPTGTVTMVGGAALTGDLILKGVIRYNLAGAYTGGGKIKTVTSGTSLAMSGGTATIGNNIVLNSLNVGGAFVTNLGPVSSGNLTVNGTISGSSDLNIAGGLGGLTLGGGSGTLTLNAQNTYTGATTLNLTGSSTVKLGINDALPITTSLSFGTNSGSTGSILDLNGFNQTVASLSFGGVGTATNYKITNTGGADATFTVNGSTTPANAFAGVISSGTTNKTSLVKDGSGGLTLSGANTYTGTTTVSGGKLVVSGSLTGTASVSVASGATLATGATGSIATAAAGNVDILGNLAPGGSTTGTDAGTLSLTLVSGGKLNFAAASTLLFGLGTTQDLISFATVGDYLTGGTGATLALDLSLVGFDYGSTYTLFHNVTTTTGNFSFQTVTGLDSTHTAVFTSDGTDYKISFASVPEPNTGLSLIFGTTALLAFRRWRRLV